MLLAYLRSCGNSATTTQIVSEFKMNVTGERVQVLRMLLKSIARFQRPGEGGVGVWTLKPEFQEEVEPTTSNNNDARNDDLADVVIDDDDDEE